MVILWRHCPLSFRAPIIVYTKRISIPWGWKSPLFFIRVLSSHWTMSWHSSYVIDLSIFGIYNVRCADGITGCQDDQLTDDKHITWPGNHVMWPNVVLCSHWLMTGTQPRWQELWSSVVLIANIFRSLTGDKVELINKY